MECRVRGECRICGNMDDLRHINLYVTGSEGLDICHDCEMRLVEFVRALKSIAARATLRAYKLARAVNIANQLSKEEKKPDALYGKD